MDMYDPLPPWGQRRGLKLQKSTFFAIYTCITYKKDPRGKPNFMVVFLDIYDRPWGQGRGSKLLEATFLAILPCS